MEPVLSTSLTYLLGVALVAVFPLHDASEPRSSKVLVRCKDNCAVQARACANNVNAHAHAHIQARRRRNRQARLWRSSLLIIQYRLPTTTWTTRTEAKVSVCIVYDLAGRVGHGTVVVCLAGRLAAGSRKVL